MIWWLDPRKKASGCWSIFVNGRRNLGEFILDFPKGWCVDIASWPFLTNKACYWVKVTSRWLCAKAVGNLKSNLTRILVNGSFQWISGDRLIKVKYLKGCLFLFRKHGDERYQTNHMLARQSISTNLISFMIIHLAYTSRISTAYAPQPPSPGAFVFSDRTYDCTQAWIGCKGKETLHEGT